MGQSVWNTDDIGNAAQAALGMTLASDYDPQFAHGVYCGLVAMCVALGSPIPRLPKPTTVDVIDTIAKELTR